VSAFSGEVSLLKTLQPTTHNTRTFPSILPSLSEIWQQDDPFAAEDVQDHVLFGF